MHSLHSLLPSISKRARRGLTSNFPHWHSAVLGGNAQPKSCTPSPKHCQFSDLPEMCVRREASTTDMGTLWCGAACNAIFSPVFHASAGASRHNTGLTRRAQQAANMVISLCVRTTIDVGAMHCIVLPEQRLEHTQSFRDTASHTCWSFFLH